MADKAKIFELAAEIERAFAEKDLKGVEPKIAKLVKLDRSSGLAMKGLLHLKKKEYSEAEEYFLESYQINQNQILAIANLVVVYTKLRLNKKAVAFGEVAYDKLSGNKSVVTHFAAALLHEQKFDRAIEILTPFFDATKPDLGVLTGLISAHKARFEFAESTYYLNLAREHFPDNPDVTRLNADTTVEEDPVGALEKFQQALAIKGDSIATRWNMSLCQLRLYDFQEGWINYDCGLEPEVGKIGRPIPKLFQGVNRVLDPLATDPNKWNIVVAEQGIGDQILFYHCMNEYLKDRPKSAIICEKRMTPIISRSFPKVPVYAYGLAQILAGNSSLINGYLPIGSIQKCYRNSPSDYEAHKKPFLIPNSGLVDKYRTQLREAVGEQDLVGISWKGGFWERSQRTKSIDIDDWVELFDSPNKTFISLQYGDVSAEREFLTQKGIKNVKFIEGIDFKKDLDGWLALAMSCDHIVSVSTALVHFAGACGQRVSVLLGPRGGPFIWGMDPGESIVYPEVEIYRKDESEGMSDYVVRVRELLWGQLAI